MGIVIEMRLGSTVNVFVYHMCMDTVDGKNPAPVDR